MVCRNARCADLFSLRDIRDFFRGRTLQTCVIPPDPLIVPRHEARSVLSLLSRPEWLLPRSV
jgi:hypothetical protein